jgi:hypothetical protein
VHKKTHERGRGVYLLGATLPPPDRLGAVFTLVRGMSLLTAGFSGYDPYRMMHICGLDVGPV